MSNQALSKLMIDVLDESCGDTTKVSTAEKMAKMGMITIKDRWITRGGVPGMSARGIKPGRWVIAFEINEHHPLCQEYRNQKKQQG